MEAHLCHGSYTRFLLGPVVPLVHELLWSCDTISWSAHVCTGMPGSETALEELMCPVLGDLLEEGIVTKIADDLYCT